MTKRHHDLGDPELMAIYHMTTPHEPQRAPEEGPVSEPAQEDFTLSYDEANALVGVILKEAEVDRQLAGKAVTKVVEEKMRRLFKKTPK